MRTAFIAGLALSRFLLTGCGSIASRWRGERGPYVGVKLSTETVTHYNSEGELIAALDIPFSAVLDTFFLPYDLTGKKPSEQRDIPPADDTVENDKR